MATPMSASTLLKVLRDAGLNVKEYKSWRTHNRNHKGAWGPINGVMMHHTVTSAGSNSVALCYNGHSTLPGPLCHGVITKSGTVYLVSSGRANHAGSGDPDVLNAVIAESYGANPPADNQASVDGNARFYGFECVNLGDGKDPWPAAQVDAMVRAAAAICKHYGWSAKSVIAHKEWQPGKIDPRGPGFPSMQEFRKRVQAVIDGKGSSTSPSTNPKETSMTKDEIFKAVWKQDKAPAPSTSTTIDKNPTWAPINMVRELYDRVIELHEKVDTGMYKRVWTPDKAPAPSTSTTIDKNPTWAPINMIRELYDRVRELHDKVDALAARLDG